MEKITAFLPVYNEENRIADTLRSLKFFDQVIVIDKGSTDRTKTIAQSFGALVYEAHYFDNYGDPYAVYDTEEALKLSRNEWLLSLTASDILYPSLHEELIRVINQKETYCDVVEIPLYRYSMGFVSEHSYFREIQYQAALYKRSTLDLENFDCMHNDPCSLAKSRIRMYPKDKKCAIYHLTHENLNMILERHLRYAKTESKENGSREEGLQASWKRLWIQVFSYFRLRSYKLGNWGKAQLCMLLLYRSANYLYLFFDSKTEKEIQETYQRIRNGDFSKIEK